MLAIEAGPDGARRRGRSVADSGYRLGDHTADLLLEFWAPTEEALLVAGARAVVDLLVEGEAVATSASRELAIAGAVDREDRLVRWLNEILSLAMLEGFLVAGAEVRLEGRGLTATLRGEADAAGKIRTELKSVTYHELAVEHGGDRWTARVVIDV